MPIFSYLPNIRIHYAKSQSFIAFHHCSRVVYNFSTVFPFSFFFSYREHRTVVIIGGGISDLSAAFRISQLKPGLKIAILESSPRVGGWIASNRYEDGTIFEHGPRTLRPVGESGAATLGLVEALGKNYSASVNQFMLNALEHSQLPLP